jgi:cobalt-zinc-cadmium efflux system outer membrane protein
MTFFRSHKPSLRTVTGFACAVVLLCVAGCATYKYAPEPLDAVRVEQEFSARNLDDTGLGDFVKSYQDPSLPWPPADWDLQDLALTAWYFQPDLQVVIAKYHKAKVHEAMVNERINPGVHIPLEHHSDNAGGKSPWLIGVLFDLVYEREGKRQARHDQAVAESGAAQINISSVAWDIYSQVRQRYMDYYSALKNDEQLTSRADITEQILKLLLRRKELGQVSGFEVSSMQIDLQRIHLQQASQRFTVIDAMHALAGAMGVPATALEHALITFADLENPGGPGDMTESELRQLALTHRLDIQQSLAEYNSYEAALRLEIEKQYPDLTLSPGFVFDQGDMIWALGAAWVLPVLHPQNEGPIREALAQREIKQAEFLALQARAINELEAARARLEAQKKALQQAQQLLQETMTRSQQLQKQYDLGYADYLELSRGKLEMAAAQQAVMDLRISVLKAAGQLEDAIQYPLFTHVNYHYRDAVLP